MDWGPMSTPFPGVSFELVYVRDLVPDQCGCRSVTGWARRWTLSGQSIHEATELKYKSLGLQTKLAPL